MKTLTIAIAGVAVLCGAVASAAPVSFSDELKITYKGTVDFDQFLTESDETAGNITLIDTPDVIPAFSSTSSSPSLKGRLTR
ncbi:MAG TPA: hypothetical protein VNZ26_09055 [Vicinamibacterales bacterium]|jgi:hypothetical protein|nr:hypothetical protein [Vicinamibacterales bacterium]